VTPVPSPSGRDDDTAASGPSEARLPPLPAADPIHGTPTAAELLGAVSEFLRADVLATTTGHTQYLLRVAINVVDIVRREVEQRPGAEARLTAALAELGVADEAGLARAVRAGAFDGRDEELRRYLTVAVATRLAASNPRYVSATDDAG
jgi:hypothetical protein